MRTAIIVTLLCVSMFKGFSQVKPRFALTASPLISWLKAEASEIDKGKIRAGVDYGLLVDLNFKDNYALTTGATVILEGGNLNYTDSVLFFNTNNPDFIPNTHARFKFQALQIPLMFKLKTNQIGYFTYFGALGLIPAFRIKARTDVDTSGVTVFDNLNIMKRKDETNGIFVANVFNLSLEIAGGFEYAFTEKTSLLVSLFFNNGFLNVIKDGDDNDKINVNTIGLRLGVIFGN